MKNKNDSLVIKDVVVLDNYEAPADKSIIYFICNLLKDNIMNEMSCIEIPISRPTYFNRVITTCISDITPSWKIEYSQITSIKAIARNLKAFVLNVINHQLPPVHFTQYVFDARDNSPNNIAHLMMQTIPFCLQARKLVGNDIAFIFTKMAPPFAQLLHEFNIKPIICNRKINASIIKISGTRGHAAHNIVKVFDCPTTTFLPNIYQHCQFVSGLIGMQKIFISRRGNRGLVNQQAVEALLIARGYQVVFMEDYSLAVQLGIASEANEIVAIHGASMGMLVLRKSIQSLIEICPPNVYQEYFPVGLGNRVKKYIQIMNSYDFNVAFNDYSVIAHFKSQPFSANINQLNHALNMTHNDNS